MKSVQPSPVVKHLVLVGGGHSHLAVLKHLGMHPVPGLAVTLISREIMTPYSGALPGFITGHYAYDDIHIDLRPLAQFAGVRIIQEGVSRIDLDQKLILCDTRPSIPFDLLSLNIGSRPDACLIPGAAEHGIGIKPIDAFLGHWQRIFDEALRCLREPGAEFTIAIVGGGPASVEFACAAQYRIQEALGEKTGAPSRLHVKLLTADPVILAAHNARVQAYVKTLLARRHIELLTQHRVTEFQAGRILSVDQSPVATDVIVYATGASIPAWPGECGLALAADGFIEVNEFLQSTSHDFVFAAGDAASMRDQPRPKSGVYAVRQGKPLAMNLLRFATGRKLHRYTPQGHALALINLANKTAIASRNTLFFKGRWVWELKNRIDGNFMRKYSTLPAMESELNVARGLLDRDAELALKTHAMRCAGCGAKVAGNILADVLQELLLVSHVDIVNPESRVEDASRIALGDNRVLLQSIDQLTAFINDPYLFARIATNHCLSDIYAMGCEAHSALAVVGLPFAGKQHLQAQLRELMLGCSAALLENDCSLIGGHSAETSELSFGLCVNGFADNAALLTKHGMHTGDVVILTKPLGTGTLLAADMRYRARHRWIATALEHMLQSNRAAARCFVDHDATACTDVTGFGLAGHLLEMLEAENVELELNLEQLPALDGALDTLRGGVFSSLHRDNSQVASALYNSEGFRGDPRLDLLFDPQTSGGLVACVPAPRAEACLQQLIATGSHAACVIGRIASVHAGAPAIVLK